MVRTCLSLDIDGVRTRLPPLLPTEISRIITEFRAWISNCGRIILQHVITHPCLSSSIWIFGRYLWQLFPYDAMTSTPRNKTPPHHLCKLWNYVLQQHLNLSYCKHWCMFVENYAMFPTIMILLLLLLLLIIIIIRFNSKKVYVF